MREGLSIRVTADPLDPAEAVASVTDPAAGGTCVFLGTVRDHSEAGEVIGLTYEAWEEVALARLGELGIGEVSVIVACSAAHRAEAFEACRLGIERLKDDVPIWKKEHLAAGESHWVMGA